MASTLLTTGRASAHAPTPSPQTAQRRRVMREAWHRARTGRIAFADALRQAWAIERGLAAEGAQARQAAVRSAVEGPPPRSLPPRRRTLPSQTASLVRHVPRREARAPRRELTRQIGHVFARSLGMVDAWIAAGRPRLTRHEFAALGVAIEACIGLVDAVAGDADLEPSLGSPERPVDDAIWGDWPHPVRLKERSTRQIGWADGTRDDREVDGGDQDHCVTDLPHDDDDPAEPSLGSTGLTGDPEHPDPDLSQEYWSQGPTLEEELTDDPDDGPGRYLGLHRDPKVLAAEAAVARLTGGRGSPTLMLIGPWSPRFPVN